MPFPTAYILALVTLLVTPALSAPINLRRNPGIMASYSVNGGLEKLSPMSWSHRKLHTIPDRDPQEYDNVVARGGASVLESRSFGDTVELGLARRAEDQTMSLVRRKGVSTGREMEFRVVTLHSCHDTS